MQKPESSKGRNENPRRLEKNPLALPSIQRSSSPRNSDSHRNNTKSPRVSPSRRNHSSESTNLPDLRNSRSSSKISAFLKAENGRSSDKSCGILKAYAVNSHRGRHHNEDRVNLMINLQRPNSISEDEWPPSSFFGLFDGHNGKTCAEFLKKNLYDYIANSPAFPYRIKDALLNGFIQADKDFLATAKENGDFSGSCAIVIMLVGDKCFVANTGNSRAFISLMGGKVLSWISSEHKPGDTVEYARIIQAGGSVYNNFIINEKGENVNLGPHLVSPGKLKISRSFGDLDAKDQQFGGIPNVIIVDPDIKTFKIKPEQDFIFLGTGCLFEIFTARELSDIIFKNVQKLKGEGVGIAILAAIDDIFAEAFKRGCYDNITIIIIGLKGLKNYNQEVAN
ncbi:hypothetical protein SteCoe_14670 [Stentor coeruleus]|uniref:protein-serine/threonine phosphatase n=1 Tax=Stentor coeruleus TaxID=5963 RepID=A0A1R2C5I8_9CILI|nr:hypothetical protein SteCoe_14670 [Stentor coeruleus]